jgi:hypothetical protein
LKSTKAVAGPGCASWYAIEPTGYVCVDGARATLDAADPVLQGIYPVGPNADSPNPHPHYGETIGAEVYPRLPTVLHQRAREWDYRFHLPRVERALSGEQRHESLLGVDLSPSPAEFTPLPEFSPLLQLGRKTLIPRSTVAWTRETLHEGRSFLLTDDLTWVPKDRVKPYSPVPFRGLHLDRVDPISGEVPKFPLALFRDEVNPQYARSAAGEFLETGHDYPRLSWVGLTGRSETLGQRTFHETVDGKFIEAETSVIPELKATTPWGASILKPDDSGEPQRGRGTWIEVSILGGWLIAYEGTQPVFVTLMSPGKGGAPHGKIPTLQTSSTPTGRFKITGKFVTATMVAPNELVHSAVPWAQNFSGPYAIHGAYWHNDWGQKKSGGCVNLSPEDAKWVFHFTEPEIPAGWHGVRWLPNKGAATTLLLRR